MKVLHLTLKTKFFDMIASGEKKEEYREMKLYWLNRFFKRQYHLNPEEYFPYEFLDELIKFPNEDLDKTVSFFGGKKVKFDYIHFANGYNRPRKLNIKWEGIRIGTGKPEWGAEPNKIYFIIKLGEIMP